MSIKCIHGFEDRSWCGYCKPKKKLAASKAKSNVIKSPKLALTKTSKICISCQKNAIAKGARGKCVSCAEIKGYKSCVKCKKMFIPKQPSAKKCGCKPKKIRKGRGSVWIVASAGLPSLGRKR
jgi:hypothetical protein